MDRILPRPDALSAPYWDGCREGELRLQQCGDCQRYQFYPRIMCSHCGSERVGYRAVSGAGQIAAFSIVRRGVSAAYEGPYVVALIDLKEGPRMMSQVAMDDVDDARLQVGAAVQVAFDEWADEVHVPVFQLV